MRSCCSISRIYERLNYTVISRVSGVTNTLGRIVAGAIADLKGVNSLLLHNVALLCAGVVCMLNQLCTTYPLMCLFAAVFGACFGECKIPETRPYIASVFQCMFSRTAAWISLTTIVLVELMGMDRLTNAFGLLTMVRGICSIFGAPVAGWKLQSHFRFFGINKNNAFSWKM